jgi:sugar lactone lactonase YvrE
MGIAFDLAGNLFIADTSNSRIRRVSGGVITTVTGNGTEGFSGDHGPAINAQLTSPKGVAVDAAGNLYIADSRNFRIRKVSNGIITTVAGNGTLSLLPVGVAVDRTGNLYVVDGANNRVQKISNGTITTIVGSGNRGFGGDNGPAASCQLNSPVGVAIGTTDTLFIADGENRRIRKVSNGVITTVAGNGTPGFSGDKGPATSAQLSSPEQIAVDALGNLYIADYWNYRIRKVSNAVITTVAGNGSADTRPNGQVLP